LSLPPHEFWQQVYPPGTFTTSAEGALEDVYPAVLPDGRQIALPIRILPGDGKRAVASLIVNQASFEVVEALVEALKQRTEALGAEVVVGVPTLGITLATALARRFGHSRIAPLGTSRKFWYEEVLSQPITSITSPGQEKRVYLDPRMLPLLEGQRVVVVDDVISSGASMAAVLRLLAAAGVRPVAVAAAMLQGRSGPPHLLSAAGWDGPVVTTIQTPVLIRGAAGWVPAD
jgi:adenine/guanine phosphoribosyltransferase-like PRPP-binding protein